MVCAECFISFPHVPDAFLAALEEGPVTGWTPSFAVNWRDAALPGLIILVTAESHTAVRTFEEVSLGVQNVEVNSMPTDSLVDFVYDAEVYQ